MEPTFLLGNALDLPLDDDSVDLIVTSPPYFGLRDYGSGPQEIGKEATPAEFLDALVAATAEMVRVVKPCGSIVVNLGDKYSTGSSGQSGLADWSQANARGGARSEEDAKRASGRVAGLPPKSLLGLPWRYAIRCMDELGLILREEVVWNKPNGLPESVRDRCARKHEQWFHFTLRPRYYSAFDLIREPLVAPELAARSSRGNPNKGRTLGSTSDAVRRPANPLGKMPGSVWTIATEPLPSKAIKAATGVEHFAAFPSEWPRRWITALAPMRGICTACGEGLAPVTERHTEFDKARDQEHAAEIAARGAAHNVMSGGTARSTLNGVTTTAITGWACGCDEPGPTTPGVVLDPFSGTGTTAIVAATLGCHGIGIDLNPDFIRIAEWRHADGRLARKVRERSAESQELTLFA
jgi:DNA modification methylase